MPRPHSDTAKRSILEIEPEVPWRRTHRWSSLKSSVRAGIGDIRTFPWLVSLAAITVFIATLLVLAGDLVTQLSEAGRVYVNYNSEVIALLEPEIDPERVEGVSAQLASIDGARLVRPSRPSDLEALPLGLGLRFESGITLVVEPSGLVDIRELQLVAGQVAGVTDVALALGAYSQRAMDLVQTVIPWLAAAFSVGGLLLVANLAFLAGATRRQEAEAMRLVGAETWVVWLRVGLLIAVPTAAVILVTTSIVAAATPSLARVFLAPEAAPVLEAGPVIRTGLVMAAMAMAIASSLGLVAAGKAGNR